MARTKDIDVALRRGLLLEILRKQPRDKKLPLASIAKALADGGSSATPRLLREEIRALKGEISSDLDVDLDQDSIMLCTREDSIIELRKKDNPELKARIARAAWSCLFGFGSMGERDRLMLPSRISGPSSPESKLAALDRKLEISFMIDAGSTNMAFTDHALESQQFPLVTHVGDRNAGGRMKHASPRFLIPRFVSNSQAISEAVYKNRHRLMFEFNLVGGTLRPKHGSYCGPLSMMVLDAWRGLETDVAMVGTTGFQSNHRGCAGFACDNFYESQIKAAFLERAWLRCLIFDCSKLLQPQARNLFVPLAGDSLDLVITDDGVSTGNDEAVTEFTSNALRSGVAVLLAGTE